MAIGWTSALYNTVKPLILERKLTWTVELGAHRFLPEVEQNLDFRLEIRHWTLTAKAPPVCLNELCIKKFAVASSNHSTVYWIDIFHIHLL